MKGKLIYDQDGWWVQHAATSPDGTEYFQADTMLHPDDVKFLEDCSLWFDNIEGKVIANPDVEFEMVTETAMSVGNSEEQDEYTIRYAKLIPSKESSYQLEYNRYMKTFVNSNLNPPTIEQFVDKVNTDADFAKYWGPGGKEQQKQLITEIMDLDAKDGLYEDEVDKLAHQYNPVMKLDAEFIRAGFKAGYNKAKEIQKEQSQPEISDEEIEKAGKEWCHAIGEDGFVNSGDDYDIHELPAFIAGAKWYREQLKNIDKKL
jgi:hypothetical protein